MYNKGMKAKGSLPVLTYKDYKRDIQLTDVSIWKAIREAVYHLQAAIWNGKEKQK